MANWQIQIWISELHNVQNFSDSLSCLENSCFHGNLTFKLSLANILQGKKTKGL